MLQAQTKSVKYMYCSEIYNPTRESRSG